MNQGWQCPICKTVYAPHVDKCECDTTSRTFEAHADNREDSGNRVFDPDTYKRLNEIYEKLKQVERYNPPPTVKWPASNPYELRDHPLFPRRAGSGTLTSGCIPTNAE